METRNIVIIGAGPCGLGASYRLQELGFKDFIMLEKNDYPGGLATSFVDEQGFTWDIGGHVVHSHYKYFDQVFYKALKDQYLEHIRESWVWLLDRFVPYPFQNNLRYLPKEIIWECLEGLLEINFNPNKKEPVNFEEWIFSIFGKGIAKYFLLPYNFKVWAHPVNLMNKEWVGDRVSVIDVKKSIENIVLEKDDVGWGPNSVFQFPLKGGTGFIWKQIASYINQDNIRLSTKVKSIDLKQKIITTQTNQKYKYQNLITTIPLTQFCKLSNHPKTDLAINNLSFSTVHIVGIGLEGKVPDHLKTKCWIYFPEDNSPFYRATVFSNYSPNNVPGHGKHWSLMFEVAQSEFKPVNQTTVVDEVIKGALNTKLIGPKNKIISKFHYKAPLGYPTPTLKRDKALKVLLPLLEKSNIYSRGRFGAWKYEVSNQDHTFMQGVEVVDRILKSKKEKTVWDPNYVNSKKR